MAAVEDLRVHHLLAIDDVEATTCGESLHAATIEREDARLRSSGIMDFRLADACDNLFCLFQIGSDVGVLNQLPAAARVGACPYADGSSQLRRSAELVAQTARVGEGKTV